MGHGMAWPSHPSPCAPLGAAARQKDGCPEVRYLPPPLSHGPGSGPDSVLWTPNRPPTSARPSPRCPPPPPSCSLGGQGQGAHNSGLEECVLSCTPHRGRMPGVPRGARSSTGAPLYAPGTTCMGGGGGVTGLPSSNPPVAPAEARAGEGGAHCWRTPVVRRRPALA